eukprot:CAMPEP_0171157604 /NCGR_PEP_ID=MMETSP0790-20130122/2051_1 /TAXON_ID=2925 /ORGANISM="Alexandrium catenella, Strain OF101" /LENGTH=40 /DNA_ID= /DNA_START= /DNA_END= /DNA_ORIENTATION=
MPPDAAPLAEEIKTGNGIMRGGTLRARGRLWVQRAMASGD